MLTLFRSAGCDERTCLRESVAQGIRKRRFIEKLFSLPVERSTAYSEELHASAEGREDSAAYNAVQKLSHDGIRADSLHSLILEYRPYG